MEFILFGNCFTSSPTPASSKDGLIKVVVDAQLISEFSRLANYWSVCFFRATPTCKHQLVQKREMEGKGSFATQWGLQDSPTQQICAKKPPWHLKWDECMSNHKESQSNLQNAFCLKLNSHTGSFSDGNKMWEFVFGFNNWALFINTSCSYIIMSYINLAFVVFHLFFVFFADFKITYFKYSHL